MMPRRLFLALLAALPFARLMRKPAELQPEIIVRRKPGWYEMEWTSPARVSGQHVVFEGSFTDGTFRAWVDGKEVRCRVEG